MAIMKVTYPSPLTPIPRKRNDGISDPSGAGLMGMPLAISHTASATRPKAKEITLTVMGSELNDAFLIRIMYLANVIDARSE